MDINITWEPPYKVKLKNGTVGWRRQWLIPMNLRGGFFIFWKRNKFDLLSSGYGVYKSDEDWYFTETKVSCSQFEDLGDLEKNKAAKKVDEEEPFVLPYYGVKNTSGLRPWQINSVSRLAASIQHYGAALDGSDLGTGKSYSACAVARELKLKLVVVCPKQVITSWTRVVRDHFKMSDDLIGIVNYEKLRIGSPDSPFASKVWNRKLRRNKFIWKIPKNSLIVWDEAQRLKNWKTKNSKTCLEAKSQGFKQLFCSATMAVNPMDLRTVGTCLKMFKTQKEYYKWLYENGVSKGNFGLKFNNSEEALRKIHKQLSARGSRLIRDEIPGFPESEIIADPYDMEEEDTDKINRILDEMSEEISRLEKREEKLGGDNRMAQETIARQKIEMIKIPLFVELAQEAMESGNSVAIFVNYTATLHTLAEKLGTKCIYNGEEEVNKVLKDTGLSIRDTNVDKFQANKERLIILNLASGGAAIGLHDLQGKHPRVSIISPSYDARHLRQALGRVWRDGSKSKSVQKIVFVAKTIEEKICKNVQQKLKNMDILNDGDLKYISQYELVKN